MSNFYDLVFYKKLPKLGYEKHNKFLFNRVSKGRVVEKALDVACGIGSWCDALKDNVQEVHGIDISEKAISKCRELKGTYNVGSSEDIKYRDGYFDLVTCFGAMEHFDNQESSLLEMSRVLKKGGLFVASVPIEEFLLAKLGVFKGTNQINNKETIYPIKEWINIFSKQFKVIDTFKDTHVCTSDWFLNRGLLLAPFKFLYSVLERCTPKNLSFQIVFVMEKI